MCFYSKRFNEWMKGKFCLLFNLFHEIKSCEPNVPSFILDWFSYNFHLEFSSRQLCIWLSYPCHAIDTVSSLFLNFIVKICIFITELFKKKKYMGVFPFKMRIFIVISSNSASRIHFNVVIVVTKEKAATLVPTTGAHSK